MTQPDNGSLCKCRVCWYSIGNSGDIADLEMQFSELAGIWQDGGLAHGTICMQLAGGK